MNEIRIEIPGVPIPWKAAFVGSKGTFSPRYMEMQIIKSLVKQQYQGPILECPIECIMTFAMPIPKSASKKKRELMIRTLLLPTGTPDRTNLAKLYEDCLQGIVFKNDSQIVGGPVRKIYAEVPKTLITVIPV